MATMQIMSLFLWFLFLTIQCILVCIATDSTDSQTVRSIWLIRHAEPVIFHEDPSQAKSKLSTYGKKQALEMARFLARAIIGSAEEEDDLPYAPWIFTSPFKPCVQTSLAIAKFFDTKIKVEHGLAEQHVGSWGIPNNFTRFPNRLKTFDDDYESKFELSEELINFKEFQFTKEFSDWWHQKHVFDKEVANYFLKLFHEDLCGDIIIITHQMEVYNIGKAIRNTEMSILQGQDKSEIHFGTYQKYATNSEGKLIFNAQGTIKVPEITTRKPMPYSISPPLHRQRKKFSNSFFDSVGSLDEILKNNVSQPSSGTKERKRFVKIVGLKTIVSPPQSAAYSRDTLRENKL